MSSGSLSTTEKVRKKLEEEEQIRKVFEQFDADNDGTINKTDLSRILRRIDPSAWTDKEINQLMDAMDLDSNGVIDVDEFIAFAFGEGGEEWIAIISKLEEECEPAREQYTGPRWMIHHRGTEDYTRTQLRIRPSDEKDYRNYSARNDEVVEVLAISSKWAKVRLSLSGASGWVLHKFLRECPEGSSFVREKAGFGRVELPESDGRLKELRKFIRKKNVTRPGSDVRAKQAWFLSGHYLGEMAKTHYKDLVFFGCRDTYAETIAESGFDGLWESLSGAMGQGAHFSPTSDGAFVKAENYMLICEVILGKQEDRLTFETEHTNLTPADVNGKGKLSVQCEVSPKFEHPMRVVYDPMQCKPVYLVKLEDQGMYRFGGK